MRTSWERSNAFGRLRRYADGTKCAPGWLKQFLAKRLFAEYVTLFGDEM
jgi:hypothetical protein